MLKWMLLPAALMCLIAGFFPFRQFSPVRDLVPVAGTISLDGRPLADADLLFVPACLNPVNPVLVPMSMGRSDKAGRFVLASTDGRQGAAPGQHLVLVSLRSDRAGNSTAPLSTASGQAESGTPPADTETGDALKQLSSIFPDWVESGLNRGNELLPAHLNSESVLKVTIDQQAMKDLELKLESQDPWANGIR